MTIGATVRRLFGRHERTVARLYRSIFIDIGCLSSLIREWMPQAQKILEVGCGEGAITEQLARLYPNADIMAIDITPRVGRLFNGNQDRVQSSK